MSWAQELFLLRKIKVLYKNKDKVLCVCVGERTPNASQASVKLVLPTQVCTAGLCGAVFVLQMSYTSAP